jgi:hypothetical protein
VLSIPNFFGKIMLFLNKNKNKNKKKSFVFVLFLLLPIFLGIIFFAESNVAYAARENCSWWARQVLFGGNGQCNETVAKTTEYVGDTIREGFMWLLYGIFRLFSIFTFVAITIFSWAIDPQYVSGKTGLLNLQAIYEMWQFIRDFFNLFFILVLLYIAFTVVFQIQKNFKQVILSLIIAALLVNFSFPISRLMIDATNVPMYFFANQMMASTEADTISKALGSTLSASRLEGILLAKDKQGNIDMEANTVSRLLMAIVFIFMFSITLLVLAIMFVIRLIALMVLVIFSSVGFAASIIPGLDKYSKMWWDNFWKYALFGPSAMLMLLIAVGFFAVIGSNQGSTFQGIEEVAGNISPEPTFLASIVMFSVPIILLWMTIGLGQTMAIAGGATISGYGHKFAAWAGGLVTKTPALWTGRKYEKYMTTRGEEGRLGKYAKYAKWLAPTAVYKGYEEWRKYSHEKDISPVTQAGVEMADAFNRLGKDHTDLAFKNLCSNISKEQKDIAAVSTNSDYVIHELINAINADDDEKTIGALQILASQNDFNDMMTVMSRIQAETGRKFGKDGKVLAPNEMSSEDTKEALKQMMLQTGTSPELAAKAMLNIANTAIAAGNVGMAGAANFEIDEKTKKGKFVISKEADQAYVAGVKLQNLETQQRQRTLHHNAIFKETALEEIVVKDENGNDKKIKISMGDINGKVGHSVLGTFTNADISQAVRSRDDLKREITNRMMALKTDVGQKRLKNMQDEMDKNPIVKEYFERVYAMTTGHDYQTGAKVDSEKFKPIKEKEK